MQPLIKENPTPAGESRRAVRALGLVTTCADCSRLRTELAKFASRSNANISSDLDSSGTRVTPLVKHVLSRELQLYFTRLTDALGTAGAGGSGATQEMRDAALGSVRSDPGLHQLVPYLIGWGGEQVRARSRQRVDASFTDATIHRLRITSMTCPHSSARSTCFTPCWKIRHYTLSHT